MTFLFEYILYIVLECLLTTIKTILQANTYIQVFFYPRIARMPSLFINKWPRLNRVFFAALAFYIYNTYRNSIDIAGSIYITIHTKQRNLLLRLPIRAGLHIQDRAAKLSLLQFLCFFLCVHVNFPSC